MIHCEQCTLKFSTEGELKTHMESSHVPNTTFIYDQCEYNTENDAAKVKHKKENHEEQEQNAGMIPEN